MTTLEHQWLTRCPVQGNPGRARDLVQVLGFEVFDMRGTGHLPASAIIQAWNSPFSGPVELSSHHSQGVRYEAFNITMISISLQPQGWEQSV